MRILSMSGYVPEAICDTVRFTGFTGERNLPHYCGYASDFISQIRQDDAIDGALFPKSCDSTRILGSYLRNCGKFIYQLHVPAAGTDKTASVIQFAQSLRLFKEAVEEHYRINLPETSERIKKLNQRNMELKKAYARLHQISFFDYLHSVHQLLSKPLSEQVFPVGLKPSDSRGKHIYLVGSFLSSESVAKKLEASGLIVAADCLPESGGLASMPEINPEGDALLHVAEALLSRLPSPSRNDFDSIINQILIEIQKKELRGVVFIMQKYCEPYDYLYAAMKKELDIRGIPSMILRLSDSEDDQKASLSLEAFAEMI